MDTHHHRRPLQPTNRTTICPQLHRLRRQRSDIHLPGELTDSNGNPATNTTGATISVSVTTWGGTLTGSVNGTLTATIPNGASNSGQITFATETGSWSFDTLTAKNTGHTDATATFNK